MERKVSLYVFSTHVTVKLLLPSTNKKTKRRKFAALFYLKVSHLFSDHPGYAVFSVEYIVLISSVLPLTICRVKASSVI